MTERRLSSLHCYYPKLSELFSRYKDSNDERLRSMASFYIEAEDTFTKKFKKYGCSWKWFRGKGITDQVYIKLRRLRQITEEGNRVEGEKEVDDLLAIVNYSIIGLIILNKELSAFSDREGDYNWDEDHEKLDFIASLYDYFLSSTLQNVFESTKNKDYGGSWKEMFPSGIVDIMLVKIQRVKNAIERDEISAAMHEDCFRDLIVYSGFLSTMISIE